MSSKPSPYHPTSSPFHIDFSKRESTGRPGTPHRFFKESFLVSISKNVPTPCPSDSSNNDSNEDIVECASNNKEQSIDIDKIDSTEQIVHVHANGLCIVTCGFTIQNKLQEFNNHQQLSSSSNQSQFNPSQDNENNRHQSDNDTKNITTPIVTIQNIEFMAKASVDGQSTGGKRKKAKQMKNKNRHGKNNKGKDGMIQACDVLAKVTFSNGYIMELKACVSGTIMEINPNLLNSYITPSSSSTGAVDVECKDDTKNNHDEKDNKQEHEKVGVDDTSQVQAHPDDGIGRDGPNLLASDPLLDGYLAVILPLGGSFPPRHQNNHDRTLKKK